MNPEIDLLRQLSLNEAVNLLRPAAIFAVGVAIYAVLIFNLYRFMSRKNIFNLDFSRYESSKHSALRKTLAFIFYIAKYILIFPLFAFFWFGVLVVMVAFLSKTKEVEDLLLIAMAVLTAVRVTSYYTEDLSRDIAKMLPFALLGIFLIDFRYFDLSSSADLLNRVGVEWRSVAYYWVFVVLLEFILRVTEPYFKALYNSIRNPRRRVRVAPAPEPESEQDDDDEDGVIGSRVRPIRAGDPAAEPEPFRPTNRAIRARDTAEEQEPLRPRNRPNSAGQEAD